MLAGLISVLSVVVGTMAILPIRYSTNPQYNVIYKDPAGVWPGQNSYSIAKPGYADARPSPNHHEAAARTWNI